MPWIELRSTDGSTAPETIADSSTIIDALTTEFGITQDPLAPSDAATAHLLQRTLDEHVYWTTVRARWLSDASLPFLAANYFGGAPQFVAGFIVWAAGMRGTLWSQGTGRYTEAELLARLEADCAVISTLLSSREAGRFLFNSETPHAIDAVAFAHLGALLKDWPGNWARTPRTATLPILAYLADVRAALARRGLVDVVA